MISAVVRVRSWKCHPRAPAAGHLEAPAAGDVEGGVVVLDQFVAPVRGGADRADALEGVRNARVEDGEGWLYAARRPACRAAQGKSGKTSRR